MNIAVVLYFAYVGVLAAGAIFILAMLYRFVKAHEAISRHLFEIAKDHKKRADRE